MNSVQTKFSPGPWETRLKTMSVHGRLLVAVSGDGYPTAFTPAWDTPEPGEVDGAEEAFANARLISAAPEMFEALVTALPYIECVEEDEAYKPGVVAKVTAQVRAALAKAEGR